MCALPVREAYDKARVAEGGIWFAPADYHLLVEADGTLALSVDEPVNYSRPSIDVLFESAAVAYGPGLLAVVLTGASADGAAGAECVRRAGGTVIVQAPESAEIPLMPQAAITRGNPQFIGSLAELTSFIIRHVTGGRS
jgi:two-component system chemotaxis response regulator CheB